MERRLGWTAGPDAEGMRLVDWLRERGCSRQVLGRLRGTEDGLLRNGVRPYGTERLREGDRIELRLTEEPEDSRIEPVRLPFGVVYEDQDLCVVDKPAGMPVHPSQNNHGNTLANALAWRCAETGEPFPFRCVSRLDAGTTGLLLVAKHNFSAAVLSRQMKAREIERTYLAVVKGLVEAPMTVDLPIGRKPGSAIERAVDRERGERAVTHCEPVRRGAGWTLVRCRLETGRTHQIRVHMSAAGHPLPGDFLYFPEDRSADRPLLHSWRLSFCHPVSGERMRFEAPVPDDMRAYMERYACEKKETDR
ncbi:MAG: RluA family pseudouridine synthase [Eubacteriales bacterium]|nr:RluA family pseudouridine synthase [Eubacteriales bacterium]